jgi:hypothetical protein
MSSSDVPATPPAEHRILGLDRRLIVPTVAVFAVVLLWNSVLPAIDEAISYHEISAGVVFDLGAASFTPTAGWLLVDPPSPGSGSSDMTVLSAGVTVRVKSGRFDGTSAQLLDRVAHDQSQFDVVGPTYPAKTNQGMEGVTRRIDGSDFTGTLFAVVDGHGNGVEAVVKGPLDSLQRQNQQIMEMLAGITFHGSEIGG